MEEKLRKIMIRKMFKYYVRKNVRNKKLQEDNMKNLTEKLIQ